MHATSTQPLADHRTVATAALAAIIFTAGVAFGAVVGTTAAPVAAPTPVSLQALDPNEPGFRLYRNGEIGLEGSTSSGLRGQRNGEINAGTGPGENDLRDDRSSHSGVGGP